MWSQIKVGPYPQPKDLHSEKSGKFETFQKALSRDNLVRASTASHSIELHNNIEVVSRALVIQSERIIVGNFFHCSFDVQWRNSIPLEATPKLEEREFICLGIILLKVEPGNITLKLLLFRIFFRCMEEIMNIQWFLWVLFHFDFQELK